MPKLLCSEASLGQIHFTNVQTRDASHAEPRHGEAVEAFVATGIETPDLSEALREVGRYEAFHHAPPGFEDLDHLGRDDRLRSDAAEVERVEPRAERLDFTLEFL